MSPLSPRMRGNLPGPQQGRRNPASIPAYAGEPRYAPVRIRLADLYPRVCGGTRNGQNCRRLRPGLSPRVRGNPICGKRKSSERRSIPACAGEPNPAGSVQCPRPVYPRVCGGTFMTAWICAAPCGLSPRVRGNPGKAAGLAGMDRSIPACAGEPSSRTGRHRERRVYPRVCGGTRRQARRVSILRGLSPRVRGNPAKW